MSQPTPPSWIGPVLGGLTLTAVTNGSSYVMEKQAPPAKAVARDFLLGAIFVVFLTQILPESTNSLILAIISLFAFKASGAPKTVENIVLEGAIGGGIDYEPITGTSGNSEDLEVKVGVPRF